MKKELQGRMRKPKIRYGKTRFEIFFENGWFTFSQLAKHNKYKHLNLDGSILYYRWKRGHKTEEMLFKPRGKYKKDSESTDNRWLFEGCTNEQIEALKAGTNKALLEA